MIADAVGSIAELASPELRVVTVTDPHQVVVPIVRSFYDRFGRVPEAGLAPQIFSPMTGGA